MLGRLGGEPVPALFRRVTPLTKADRGGVSRKCRSPEGKGGSRLLHALMARVGEERRRAQAQVAGRRTGSRRASRSADAEARAGRLRACLHRRGAGARYSGAVSCTGYLAAAMTSEAAAFHAWAEAYDEGLGWIGFDPMLGYCPTERHVRVAVGLDALSAAPVRSVPADGDAASRSASSVEAAQ